MTGEDIRRTVYATWSLADLDWLHEQAGIGPEWLASDDRAKRVAKEEGK